MAKTASHTVTSERKLSLALDFASRVLRVQLTRDDYNHHNHRLNCLSKTVFPSLEAQYIYTKPILGLGDASLPRWLMHSTVPAIKKIQNRYQTIVPAQNISPWQFLGRLFWVDLIKWVWNVRPSVHKMFFWFQWNLACRWMSMSDAQWYEVWPDRRSRSRSRALRSWKSFHFQKLSPLPFTIAAGNWPKILKLGHNI